MTGLKLDLVVGDARSDAVRPFVDVEVGADAVSRSVTVVESVPPQGCR